MRHTRNMEVSGHGMPGMATARRLPGTVMGIGVDLPIVRMAAGGGLSLGLQPAGWIGSLQSLAFALIAALLIFGCLLLLRSRKRDREEAEAERVRHQRQMDELQHAQQVRIQQAVESGSLRERELTDQALEDRLNGVLQALGEGFGQLDERLDEVARREHEREKAHQSRLDEAMTELRLAGRASVRFVLEQFGLHNALEDLRWNLEASGKMRVALDVQGLGHAFGRGQQTAIYHLVSDSVDALMGYENVDHLAIRLERSGGKCLLAVENNGGEVLRDQRVSENGLRRLEGRVARLNGSMDAGRLPHGGYALNVEIPFAP